MNDAANNLDDNAEPPAYNEDDDDFLHAPGNNSNNDANTAIQMSPVDSYTADDHDFEQEAIDTQATGLSQISISPPTEVVADASAVKKTQIKIDKVPTTSYGVNNESSESSIDDHDPVAVRRGTQQSQVSQLSLASNTSMYSNDSHEDAAPQTVSKQYHVSLNDKSFLSEPEANYPDNYVKTSKYTLLTFLPLNLFEQFRRVANMYFLIIITIQLLPNVAPFPIGTSIMPLAFILCVGAIKDGLEDYDRHKNDKIANSLPIMRLNASTGEFTKSVSAALQPSDIILIRRGQQIPADCIVLGCDNSNSDNMGVCYINTSSMDGENAPKLRRALRLTVHISDAAELAALRGYLKCPPNNKALHGFNAAIAIKKDTLPKHHHEEDEEDVTTKTRKRKHKIKIDKHDTDDAAAPVEVHKHTHTRDKLSAVVPTLLSLNHERSGSHQQIDVRSTEDQISGLGDINFVYRGSKLANSEFIYALVIFVGRETKLMLNRNQVPFKFSKFEKILNRMIVCILLFNFLLCLAFGFAANVVQQPFVELHRASWFASFGLDVCSWLILTSWMIPFSLYVTLELVKMIQAQWLAWDQHMTYVDPTATAATADDTTEAEWDGEYGGHRRHAKTKNSNLNEELGHIDYIFTDKTGTLTQNAMELSQCSVGGRRYANDAHANGDNDLTAAPFPQLMAESMDFYQRKLQSYKTHKHEPAPQTMHAQIHRDLSEHFAADDSDRLTSLEHGTHFLFNMLLCSATLPSRKQPQPPNHDANEDDRPSQSAPSSARVPSNTHLLSKAVADSTSASASTTSQVPMAPQMMQFQSPSPDEVAYAEALCAHGLVLEERQVDGTTVIGVARPPANAAAAVQHRLRFKVLATLEFTARRKRMTVIVEDELGQLHLYSKGADSTLLRMCRGGSGGNEVLQATKRDVGAFAREGSRTMVLAWKRLSAADYDEFAAFYREAEISLAGRAQLMENAFSCVEHSLTLLGCTAVEDQMQEGVAHCMSQLKAGDIKVIMLTGDKEETAVSIARQSRLIEVGVADADLMRLSVRHASKYEEKHMRRMHKKLSLLLTQQSKQQQSPQNGGVLVLNGDALEICLHEQLLPEFMRLFECCSTLICNRCNPSQKAMLVAMVKHNLDGVALAIGDGANDVSMIQASNVGVGIMGKEGTQAALAADFVIHRFSHLQRLLFVHGRYSFLRTSQLSLISLYKNMAFMLTVCYYGAYSLFTARSCFDPYLMSSFNLFFAALFPLCVGAFEQDIAAPTAMHHSAAYSLFKLNSHFNLRMFAFWMFTAAWQSAVWFGTAVFVYGDNLDVWHSHNGGLPVWGTQLFTTNVIVICLKMMMESRHWNVTYFVSTAIGIVSYFVVAAVLSNWLSLDPDMYKVTEFTFGAGLHWLLLLLQCVLCLGPGILYNLWRRERNASLSDMLYEAQKFGYLTQKQNDDDDESKVYKQTKDIVKEYMSR